MQKGVTLPTGRHSIDDSYSKANFVLSVSNAMQLLKINQDQQKLSQQLSVSERQSAERSYAHWRQTPDGKTYEAWKLQVSPIISLLSEQEKRWREAWNQLLLSSMTPEEAKAEQTGDFIAPPRKHPIVKKLLLFGFCIFPACFLISFINDPLATFVGILGFYGAMLGALVIAIFGRRMPFWIEANEKAREESRIRRAERLGVSPQTLEIRLTHPWVGSGISQSARAAELIANEIVHHPMPSELIDVTVPEVIPDSEIPFEQLKPVAEEIRHRLEEIKLDE